MSVCKNLSKKRRKNDNKVNNFIALLCDMSSGRHNNRVRIQLVGQSCNCYHPRPQVADSGTTFRYGG